MRFSSLAFLPIIPAIALAGCQQREVSPPVEKDVSLVARAPLKTADGTDVGEAIVAQGSGDLLVLVDARGMPEGVHGAHIHMTGTCDGPDFTSAGGHWNPANVQHGLENPQGAHKGDLVSLTIDRNGKGSLKSTIKGATLQDGPTALMDGDGAAFVVHADADDQKTDPSGDSGSRIACGVFQMSQGGAK